MHATSRALALMSLTILQFRKFCLPLPCLKHKNWKIQSYNFACGVVWLSNILSFIKRNVSKLGAEKNVWTKKV
jgi:hypothetical protein